MDLALNNQQRLICHKTVTTNKLHWLMCHKIKPNQTIIIISLAFHSFEIKSTPKIFPDRKISIFLIKKNPQRILIVKKILKNNSPS